jgi:hypothetical protein
MYLGPLVRRAAGLALAIVLVSLSIGVEAQEKPIATPDDYVVKQNTKCGPPPLRPCPPIH